MKEELLEVIYESRTVEAFEHGWKEVITKYELESNEWLMNLIEEKQMWVPAYMKDQFWAGMRTTQRVETSTVFLTSLLTGTRGYVSLGKSIVLQ